MLFKGRANRRKSPEMALRGAGWEFSPTKNWWDLPSFVWEHSPSPARRIQKSEKRSSNMLGKLAGAWLGEKIAGPNKGAKGAILGYGAVALARRSVPVLAAA